MTIKQENQEQVHSLEAKVEQLTQELQAKDKQLEETKKSLQQQEKLAFFGKNVVRIIHEIRNPVGAIELINQLSFNSLEKLLVAEDGQEQEWIIAQNLDYLVQTKKYLERIERIISLLNKQIITGDDSCQDCNLKEIIDRSLELTIYSFKNKYGSLPIEIQKDYDSDFTQVQLYLLDFERAMCNLIENSLYSLKQKQNKNPQFQPKLLLSSKQLDQGIQIVVEDNGEGIKTQHKTRVFEEFYTTKKSEGTGLGLFIVREIIEEKHGGKITLETSLDEFTRFTITIP